MAIPGAAGVDGSECLRGTEGRLDGRTPSTPKRRGVRVLYMSSPPSFSLVPPVSNVLDARQVGLR